MRELELATNRFVPYKKKHWVTRIRELEQRRLKVWFLPSLLVLDFLETGIERVIETSELSARSR
jgi:hypothetical protein